MKNRATFRLKCLLWLVFFLFFFFSVTASLKQTNIYTLPISQRNENSWRTLFRLIHLQNDKKWMRGFNWVIFTIVKLFLLWKNVKKKKKKPWQMILREITQDTATKQVLVHLNFSPLFPSWPAMTCPSTYFAGDFSFPCSWSQNIKIGYELMVRKNK